MTVSSPAIQDEHLHDLFDFLADKKQRNTALDLLLPYTTEGFVVDFIKRHPEVFQKLLQGELCLETVKCLINFSRDSNVAALVSERINDYLSILEEGKRTELVLMLLCNLAHIESCRGSIIQHVSLIGRYASSCQYARFILVNISQAPVDCLEFIDFSTLDSLSSAMLKNQLFQVALHERALSLIDMQVLKEALRSECGDLYEALLLLCTSREGRDRLRAVDVYEVLKVVHEKSEREEFRELIERIVELLVRDEEPETIDQ